MPEFMFGRKMNVPFRRGTALTIPFLDLHAAYKELQAELDAAYHRVMDSGWYILGTEVDAFEREFASYCGARHCVAMANGLDALHLILRAWDVGPGDEVIVPSNTYIASWLAVTQAGAIPVPVEPVLETSNLDASLVEAAITPRTRAIMPVHLYGQPAEMAPLMDVAARHGLKVVEDAAQAHGASYRGTRAGSLGHAAGWSFYPGKNLGAYGDAGGVTTDDDELADRLRVLRNYGSRVKYFNEVAGLQLAAGPAAGRAFFASVCSTSTSGTRGGAGWRTATCPDCQIFRGSLCHMFRMKRSRRGTSSSFAADSAMLCRRTCSRRGSEH